MRRPPCTRVPSLAFPAFAIAAITMTAACGSMEGDPNIAQESWGSSVAGAWRLPAAVRAVGDRQHTVYDEAPLWNGGANCSGMLFPGTRALGDFLVRQFSQISSYGGYSCRQNTGDLSRTSVHGTGRAIDIMIPMDHGDADNTAGDEIANWLVMHAEEIGVQYIIWDRTSWGAYRSVPKDQPYGGPNPHIDHIHAELTIEGSRERTPWFRDRDGDGIASDHDNCPDTANRGQEDTDGDGVGNACDNCARDRNHDQADRDGDRIGDACDNCVHESNRAQDDGDGDGVGNACDNCPAVASESQSDLDGDGRGNVCDPDMDGDGVPNDGDNCPRVPNPTQADTDRDGVGDRCANDDDGDGVLDERDNCPRDANADQVDLDHDSAGDVCDRDDDADTIADTSDNCPRNANREQADRDGDGQGDVCDPMPDAAPTMPGTPDDDGDPHADGSDAGVAGDPSRASDAGTARDTGPAADSAVTTAGDSGGRATGGDGSTRSSGIVQPGGCSARPARGAGAPWGLVACAMCAVAASRARRRRSR